MNQSNPTAQKLVSGLEKVIKGKTETIKLVVAALLADGHVLLEDYPGSGKTTLSKTLGALISHRTAETKVPLAPFRRIQFTPDMLPGDVLGVSIFDAQSKSFRFIPGPIFGHIILADELNRTGPKVQSAFLECLAEKQVTLDNVTHPLGELFFVIGTQNPLDIAGTYPLPIVQLDRFLFRIPMSYVDAKTEFQILAEHEEITQNLASATPVVTADEILIARQEVRQVKVADALRQAMVEIVQSTRGNPLLQFGLSTRAALCLQQGCKAWAYIQGKTFADEEDLRVVAPFVLSHRLKFNASSKDSPQLLKDLLKGPLERLISRR